MNILTFDIEDWYNADFVSGDFEWNKFEVRIYEGVNRILNELDSHDLKATFFCLGWLAEKHPGVINEIDKRGHEVACHSYQHQLAFRFNRAEFCNDTIKAKDLLEDAIGKPVNKYRAPGFSITKNNKWAIEELLNMGFEYDASVFPAPHDYGGMTNYGNAVPGLIITDDGRSIKEFPMNFRTIFGQRIVFSGGGFFRLLNYQLIKKWTEKSDYVMTYFHPRDFDPQQPIVEGLPWIRRFKSYVGLKGSFSKLQKYLRDFDFLDIESASKQIDWSKVDKINLSEL